MVLEAPSRCTAGPLRLSCVDPTSYAGWDGLLAEHPGATFFHTAAWSSVLTQAYGFTPQCLAAIDAGRLVALLPVMECASWLRGRRGVSLPFTDECGPLGSADFDADRLFDAGLEHGRNRGWRSLEVRFACGLARGGASLSFAGHRLSLQQSSAHLFDGCESSVRRAIRKAEKSAFTVGVHTDLASLAAYYRLHCRTRQKHGVPPQPFSFFRAIADHVLSSGRGFVVLASKGGQPVAGAVFFHFNGRAVYKFSASDERFQECRGPNLVIWAALQHLQQIGCTELTFGRTSLANEGLRRFKAGFGTEEYSIRYSHYSFKQQSFVSQVDRAEGATRRLFRLLPLPLSRLIGAAAYRHMA